MGIEEAKREIARCAKCGKCRSVCPVFLETGDETRVARGRISLAEAVFQGEIFYTPELRDYIYSCKKCLRCQAVCPSDVNFSEIIDALLEGIEKNMGISRLARLVLRHILPRRRLFDFIIRAAAFGQRFIPGERQGTLRHLPLFFMGRKWVPALAPQTALNKHRQTKKLARPKMRVGFFVGCMTNYANPHIADSLINVLNMLDIEVVVPPEQVCCGIPARSLGDTVAAKKLAEKNRKVFEAENLDAIVSGCGTCTLTIKRDYLKMLGDSWKPMHDKIYDINVFLEKFTEYETVPLDSTVTYHDPCHLRWGQGIIKEPREVIKRCATLKEMEYPERCCGGGGIFAILYRDLSMKIGEHKIKSIERSGAEKVVTSCPGCVLQISELVANRNLPVETLHVVELLERTIKKNGRSAQVKEGTAIKEKAAGAGA
ncbi:MAG: (Fe-S)-binding protein [Candidatus Brocadiales bacterium]